MCVLIRDICKFQVFDQKWHLMATEPLKSYIILFVCSGWSRWWPRFQSKFVALEAVTVHEYLVIEHLWWRSSIILVKGTSSLNYVELTDNFFWHSRVYGALNLHGVRSIHIHLEFVLWSKGISIRDVPFFTHHYSEACLMWMVLHPDIWKLSDIWANMCACT